MTRPPADALPGSAERTRETELARQERDAGARELSLDTREKTLQAQVVRAEQRLGEVSVRLAVLAQGGSAEARHLLETLPPVAPGPGVKERSRALAFRQEALLARQAAAAAREKALRFVADALTTAELAYQQAENNLARWETAQHVAALDSPPVLLGRPLEEPAAPAVVRVPAAGPERSVPRQRVDCRVDVWTEHAYYQGSGRDLSPGGLFVACLDVLPVGTRAAVGFALPEGLRIEAPVVVKWIRELPEASAGGTSPGMGLAFVSLNAIQQAALARHHARPGTPAARPTAMGLA